MVMRSDDILDSTLGLLRRLWKRRGDDPGDVRKIAIKPQWNLVASSRGRYGIAINFTAKHAVYGEIEADIGELKQLVGRPLFEAAEQIGSPDMLKRSVAMAVLSALSQPFLLPESLVERGYHPRSWDDFKGTPSRAGSIASLVTADDVVAVVGYGGLVRLLAGRCRDLHVTEMRPKHVFQSLIIGDKVEYGPSRIRIHGEPENREVLGRADVVFITGSALVNGTFNELLGYAENARLVGMYGPSASIIPDMLFERGVDFVSSMRVSDPERFEDDMVNEVDMEVALKKHQEPYLAFREKD